MSPRNPCTVFLLNDGKHLPNRRFTTSWLETSILHYLPLVSEFPLFYPLLFSFASFCRLTPLFFHGYSSLYTFWVLDQSNIHGWLDYFIIWIFLHVWFVWPNKQILYSFWKGLLGDIYQKWYSMITSTDRIVKFCTVISIYILSFFFLALSLKIVIPYILPVDIIYVRLLNEPCCRKFGR